MDILPFIAMVLGIYIVFKADKMKDSGMKALYAIVGLIIAFLALMITMNGGISAQIGAPVFFFGLFGLGTLYLDGSKKAIAGAIAVLIFLSILF